jgi:hypothetical protein
MKERNEAVVLVAQNLVELIVKITTEELIGLERTLSSNEMAIALSAALVDSLLGFSRIWGLSKEQIVEIITIRYEVLEKNKNQLI